MKSYKWVCSACKSPNVLVHDDTQEGQVALNCRNCGEPGVFEPEERVVKLSGYDVCSTAFYPGAISTSTNLLEPRWRI